MCLIFKLSKTRLAIMNHDMITMTWFQDWSSTQKCGSNLSHTSPVNSPLLDATYSRKSPIVSVSMNAKSSGFSDLMAQNRWECSVQKRRESFYSILLFGFEYKSYSSSLNSRPWTEIFTSVTEILRPFRWAMHYSVSWDQTKISCHFRRVHLAR